MKPYHLIIAASVEFRGAGIGNRGALVSFDAFPWLAQASEDDVGRLFHAEYCLTTVDEILDWSMRRDPDFKERVRIAERSSDWTAIRDVVVDLPAVAEWVATHRADWEFVPEMCQAWGVDLLVVMARQGGTGAQESGSTCMSSPTRSQTHELVGSLTESELTSLLEAARVALADGEIAAQIADSMDISDSELSAMQDRLHSILKG